MGARTELRTLLAKASPLRSGDQLAGVAARTQEERVRAQMELADTALQRFLDEPVVPYETDEVTRLIVDTHDKAAFAPVRGLSVGQFREHLLAYGTGPAELRALAPGITPEMAAAVSKLMGNQDLVLVANKFSVVARFRNTFGLPGHLAVRLQPNHPTDDPRAIAASTLDGLLMGAGDAVIGINPASDNVASLEHLVRLIDELVTRGGKPAAPTGRGTSSARRTRGASGPSSTRWRGRPPPWYEVTTPRRRASTLPSTRAGTPSSHCCSSTRA